MLRRGRDSIHPSIGALIITLVLLSAALSLWRLRAHRMAGRIVIRSTRGGGTQIRVILDNPASHQVK
jgi:hypothetical protein